MACDHWRPSRRQFLWIVVAVSSATVLWPAVTASQPADESQVKATFLLNFARFTEWPDTASDARRTFVVGVLGDEPLGDVLDQVVAAETIGGRLIEVRRLSSDAEGADECHVLFVGSWAERRLAQMLDRAGTSVLTVGETVEFAQQGGMIALLKEDSRIRFAINIDAAGRSRLKLSSKLLTLARVVRDNAPDGSAALP